MGVRNVSDVVIDKSSCDSKKMNGLLERSNKGKESEGVVLGRNDSRGRRRDLSVVVVLMRVEEGERGGEEEGKKQITPQRSKGSGVSVFIMLCIQNSFFARPIRPIPQVLCPGWGYNPGQVTVNKLSTSRQALRQA